MSGLYPSLKANQQRGSKPRCHLLTQGSREAVAARLSGLVKSVAVVAPEDRWMPEGFNRTKEATLPEADELLPQDTRLALRDWWLAVSPNTARTPNWDIAATCSVDGKPGLLLVEAKAHHNELIHAEAGKGELDTPLSVGTRRNLLRIDWCMRDANVALGDETGLVWALSRDWHYQMSNRFAWAWKLAEVGVPVVLMYLGFLKADEMSKTKNEVPLASHHEWETLVRAHSAPLFSGEVWGRAWSVNGVPIIPIIRSYDQPLIPEVVS